MPVLILSLVMVNVINTFIELFFGYFLIGALFGVWFVLKGAAKLDEGVKGAPWHFRLVLFPGSCLLWPVLVYKLIKKKP